MRKLLKVSASAVAYLSVARLAFADVLNVAINASNRAIAPDTAIGAIVSFIVAFIIVIAFLAALLYIVIGAFQWITSGGDKQRVADARNHIIAAIIGLIVIALSFVIINVIITTLGLGSLTNLTIPTLNNFAR